MTKQNRKQRTQKQAEAISANTGTPIADIAQAIEAAAIEAMIDTKPRSVVGLGYKATYRERAIAAGRTSKASRRCNGDWLAQRLEEEALDGDGKLMVGRFERILDENGVKHEHWNRTTNGWQGRLRMSGSMSLRAILKKQGFIVINGEHAAPSA